MGRGQRRGRAGGPGARQSGGPRARRRLPGALPRAARGPAGLRRCAPSGPRGDGDRARAGADRSARRADHRRGGRLPRGTQAMTGTWIAVAAIGVATIAIKGLGPVLAGGRELPEPFAGVVPLLAPALLAALVATQTFGEGRALVIDERAAGLAAAAVPVALRAPILVSVGVAA